MSQNKDQLKLIGIIYQVVILTFVSVIVTAGLLTAYFIDPQLAFLQSEEELPAEVVELDEDRIEDGIHVRTGLVDAEGLKTVVQNCTACHSAKIITQNRMNEERWVSTIKWMQETQNLWDLGENQEVIVKYLVTNYPPKKKGRRENLSDIQWYVLDQ